MNADRTIPAILLTLFLVVAIPTGLYLRKLPAATITPNEAELAKFTSQAVDMSLPQSPRLFSGLACPVTQPQAKQSPGIGQSPDMTPTPQPVTPASAKPAPLRSLASLPVVSMISYDGATRTAIVDNRVVTEGSELDGGKIVKIEENRVLMRKNGKNLWLTIQ